MKKRFLCLILISFSSVQVAMEKKNFPQAEQIPRHTIKKLRISLEALNSLGREQCVLCYQLERDNNLDKELFEYVHSENLTLVNDTLYKHLMFIKNHYTIERCHLVLKWNCLRNYASGIVITVTSKDFGIKQLEGECKNIDKIGLRVESIELMS